MSEEYGPDFITITDEEGNDIELELLETIEYNGERYMAFFPAEEANEDGTEPEASDEDDEEEGLIILKVIEEDGEDLLSTIDDEAELEAVYEQFMEVLVDGEDDED